MDVTGMNTQLLTHTLVESFNALADEVQNLSDRQTVLEHKLRYAHEQVSFFFPSLLPFPSLFLSTIYLLSITYLVVSIQVKLAGFLNMPYGHTRRR